MNCTTCGIIFEHMSYNVRVIRRAAKEQGWKHYNTGSQGGVVGDCCSGCSSTVEASRLRIIRINDSRSKYRRK